MTRKFIDKKRRIYIELVNRCNLSCSFCPYSDIEKHRKDIEIGMLKDILKDIKENINYRIIYFHNLGEPLLYDQLEEVLIYCDKNKINYGITTNGLLLSKKIGILKNKHINQINISYQATRDELHKERRMKLSMDDYRKLIIDSINELQAGGYAGVIKIKLLTTNSNSFFKNKIFNNIESIDEFILEIEKFYFNFYGLKLNKNQKIKLLSLDLNKHAKIQIKEGVFVEIFPFLSWGNYGQKVWPSLFGRCDAINEQLIVLSNGDVLPCCYDIESEMILGNTAKQKLSEILASKNTKELVKEFSSLLVTQKRCKKCLGKISLRESICEQFNVLFNPFEHDGEENIIVL